MSKLKKKKFTKENIKKNALVLFDKTKKNANIYKKTNVLFITFVLTSVLNAWLLRALTVQNVLDPRPVLADLSVVIMIGALGYFIKPKHQYKYFLSLAFIFTLICIINSMYYTNYLSFASVSLLETSSQIVDVGDAVVENVMEIKDFSYIWQLLAIFFVNKSLKKRKYFDKVTETEKGKIQALNTLVIGLIAVGFFVSTLSSVDVSRLGKQWNREFIVMRFGIFVYQVNDIITSLKPQISPLFGYDEAAKDFRDYYDSKDMTHEDNKYTNMFKGKNILMIHAESIQTYLLDTSFNGESVVPNLKRLSEEGLYFSNFYAQESVGTSSDSEFTLSTSLMPASSGTVFISYWDREYLTSQKLLKDKGYYTFSMHGNNGSMWNRNVMHPQLGYDKFYNYKKDYKIDETIGLGLSDKSFFKQSVPKIKKISETKQNFYGTMIMLSNHTPWSKNMDKLPEYPVTMDYEELNEETGEMETKTANYMEGTKMGNYFKFSHYADEALGEFLEQLDAEGILDNTVVVIYGDHDAKLKKNDFKRFYNYDPTTDSIKDETDPTYVDVDFYKYELDRKVPFIIWSKDKKLKEEVTEVMGMYDVGPTLGNMFDFYNPYALGNDIFNVKENIVVFPDGNWLTNKMYYNSQKEEGKPLTEDAVSVDYINEKNEYTQKLLDVSNNIIVYDLIKKSNETKKLIEDYDK